MMLGQHMHMNHSQLIIFAVGLTLFLVGIIVLAVGWSGEVSELQLIVGAIMGIVGGVIIIGAAKGSGSS